MKKILLWIVGVIVALAVVVVAVWSGEIKTLASIEQVGDDPYLYTCEYSAPYDLDAVVDAGIDANAKLVAFVIGKLSRGLYKPQVADPSEAPVAGEAAGNAEDEIPSFACTSFQVRKALVSSVAAASFASVNETSAASGKAVPGATTEGEDGYKTEAGSEPEGAAEAGSEAESGSGAESVTETASEAESEAATEPETEPVPEPESEPSNEAPAAAGEGGWLFGRNYDYFTNPTLVLTSHPKDGYASISTCDLSHLGYSLEKLPTKLAAKALCLAAVYAPMDGMNEKGLCVSIMALPKQAAWQDSGKPVVGTSVYMRLLLDRCATVEEALELTRSLDIRHDQAAGGGYHYLIADAEGHCAAVEFDLFDGWKTLVTEKPDSAAYMHMTNHLLYPKYYTTEPDPVLGNPHSRSWWRYGEVKSYMDERKGTVTLDEAQECLARVHWKDLVWENGMVENTQWSNVYDQSELTLRLRDWYDYDTTREFSLQR